MNLQEHWLSLKLHPQSRCHELPCPANCLLALPKCLEISIIDHTNLLILICHNKSTFLLKRHSLEVTISWNLTARSVLKL